PATGRWWCRCWRLEPCKWGLRPPFQNPPLHAGGGEPPPPDPLRLPGTLGAPAAHRSATGCNVWRSRERSTHTLGPSPCLRRRMGSSQRRPPFQNPPSVRDVRGAIPPQEIRTPGFGASLRVRSRRLGTREDG